MKTLNDYMAMSYRMEIIEDKDEGGFVVSYPDLPGCITCGETVESAVENALDAKKAWLEAALEDGVEIHEPDSLEDYSITDGRFSGSTRGPCIGHISPEAAAGGPIGLIEGSMDDVAHNSLSLPSLKSRSTSSLCSFDRLPWWTLANPSPPNRFT